MKNALIITLKVFVHAVCLYPIAWILLRFAIAEDMFSAVATQLSAHNIPLDLGPDPINTITHITGYTALFTLITSLAITPLRRLPGLNWLIRFRRLLGLYAFFYATLHLITYMWLFSNFKLPAILVDIFKRRFIFIGMAAWLMLLPLALTSTTWAIRKLGKNWQRLHRLAYFAAIAGIIHYWWLVKTGNLTPLTMTLVLTALLIARLLWSLWQNWKKKAHPTPTRLTTKNTPGAAPFAGFVKGG